MSSLASDAFARDFARIAASVRRWLTLRAMLAGLGLGLVLGGGFAAAVWALCLSRGPSGALGRGELRLVGAAVFALVGVLCGVWFDRRRRLSRDEIGLYLDRRLASDEVISTALETNRSNAAARAVVVAQAAQALAAADSKRTRPRLLSRVHALVPSGAALVGLAVWLPLPPAPPAPPRAPGSEIVTAASVPELDRFIEDLESTKARDPEQQKRFDELAEKARKLRENLRAGAPKRDVQTGLAELSEGMAAERMDLGSGERRRGFEAALAKLQAAGLDPARRALADRDLTEFDEKMDRAARELEKASRDKAKQALADAAQAARKEGAEDVAKMLEEQKQRFEATEKKAEQLRELSKALADQLPEEAKNDLERMDRTGDREAEKRLAEAMEKALAGLSPEERAKLAQKMAEVAQRKPDDAGSVAPKQELSPEMKKKLEELAKELATEEGMKKLIEQLREQAKDKPPSSEADRQQKLEDAQARIGEARAKLGAGESSSQPGDASAQGSSSSTPGRPGTGKGPGGSKDKHPSTSPKSSASSLKAHVSSKLNPGAPMPGSMPGRTDARPGETANLHGTGKLGQVGPDEISGVSESDVPEEYREQVGRYFQP